MNSLSPEAAFYLINYVLAWNTCCHVWAGSLSCNLDLLDKLQIRVCRAVGPSLVASLEQLGHRRNVVSVSKSFLQALL